MLQDYEASYTANEHHLVDSQPSPLCETNPGHDYSQRQGNQHADDTPDNPELQQLFYPAPHQQRPLCLHKARYIGTADYSMLSKRSWSVFQEARNARILLNRLPRGAPTTQKIVAFSLMA